MIHSNFLKFFCSTNKLVIVRSGKNVWNKMNRWTGWVDIRLGSQGIRESRKCGKLLNEHKFNFDQAYTSDLTRSIQTLNYIFDQIDQHYVPVHKTWRLNQKHYGALQGQNKLQISKKYGVEVTQQWRRKLNSRPPYLQVNNPMHLSHDPKYSSVDPALLPNAQSLQDVINRIEPLWKQQISQKIKNGKKILMVTHGNTIRAIVRLLSHLPQEQLKQFIIPHCIPLIFNFDQNMKLLNYEFLGDQEQIELQKRIIRDETNLSKNI